LQQGVTEELAVQIERDVIRTLPRFLESDQRITLRRVLRAYARLNPVVGYCQGMSFLACVPLLLAFDEAAVLAGLQYVIEYVCPGYHGPRLEGYFRDVGVLSVLVSCCLPEIHHEMEALCMPLHLLATDHLLTFSARTWPLNPVVRLWDIVLMEGSPALLGSFLALLQIYFLDAVASVKSSAGGDLDEGIPVDVAFRFRELARLNAGRDIDEVVHLTRKFIPLVRGEPVSGDLHGGGAFLDWIRAKVEGGEDGDC